MLDASLPLARDGLSTLPRTPALYEDHPLTLAHSKRAVESKPNFDFLKDLVQAIPDPTEGGAGGEEKPKKRRKTKAKATAEVDDDDEPAGAAPPLPSGKADDDEDYDA